MGFDYVLVRVADLYCFILMVYILMSWFPITPGGIVYDVQQFLAKICEPFLAPFRKIIPPIGGMVDISPIIAFFVLQFAVRLIVSIF